MEVRLHMMHTPATNWYTTFLDLPNLRLPFTDLLWFSQFSLTLLINYLFWKLKTKLTWYTLSKFWKKSMGCSTVQNSYFPLQYLDILKNVLKMKQKYFQIMWGSCALVFASNIVMFLTILGFFVAFNDDSNSYSNWWRQPPNFDSFVPLEKPLNCT